MQSDVEMDEVQEGETEKMKKVFVFVCCCVFFIHGYIRIPAASTASYS